MAELVSVHEVMTHTIVLTTGATLDWGPHVEAALRNAWVMPNQHYLPPSMGRDPLKFGEIRIRCGDKPYHRIAVLPSMDEYMARFAYKGEGLVDLDAVVDPVKSYGQAYYARDRLFDTLPEYIVQADARKLCIEHGRPSNEGGRQPPVAWLPDDEVFFVVCRFSVKRPAI